MSPASVLGFFLLAVVSVHASFNFIAIGDWGADPFRYADDEDDDPDATPYGVADQQNVAARMEQWAGEHGIDIVVALADNFYPDGLESMDDPRFEVSWRDMYNGTNMRDAHWYLSLGNHDHFLENAFYQVNWTNFEPRWHLPDLWFDEYFEKDDFKIHLIALDTELLAFNWWNRSEEYNRDVQVDWLNQTLRNAEPSDWTIVYGHHPLHSCGRYAPGNFVLQDHIEHMLVEHDVVLYLDGHDHNLQHITKNNSVGPQFVVSGSGGKGRYEMFPLRCERLHKNGFTLEFFAERYGFVGFEVTKDQITGTYYGDVLVDGELEELYSFDIFRDQLIQYSDLESEMMEEDM